MRKLDGDDAWESLLRSTGLAVQRIWVLARGQGEQELSITEVRCKLNSDNSTSVLLVAKAIRGDESLVAFVGDSTLAGALIGLRRKLEGGSLKWREDRPWGER